MTKNHFINSVKIRSGNGNFILGEVRYDTDDLGIKRYCISDIIGIIGVSNAFTCKCENRHKIAGARLVFAEWPEIKKAISEIKRGGNRDVISMLLKKENSPDEMISDIGAMEQVLKNAPLYEPSKVGKFLRSLPSGVRYNALIMWHNVIRRPGEYNKILGDFAESFKNITLSEMMSFSAFEFSDILNDTAKELNNQKKEPEPAMDEKIMDEMALSLPGGISITVKYQHGAK